MALSDVFNSDIFSTVSLTAAIEKAQYKPQRIGEMGLFNARGIATTTAVVERNNKRLALLPTGKRGGPATPVSRAMRDAVPFLVPHILAEDTVFADDVLNVRAFGSEDQQQGLQQLIAERLDAMREKIEVTLEYHRIGAIKGQVLDADGTSVVTDLFDAFGIEGATYGMELDDADTDIRAKCTAVARLIEDALGAAATSGIHVFCGDTFFDALISHDDAKAMYNRFQEGQWLRDDVRKGFPIGNVFFENYRGKVSGQDFIAATEAHAFPLGVQDMFITAFAPATYAEAAGTLGIPVYSKSERMEFDVGMKLQAQSNPACLCTRPEALLKLELGETST